MVKVYEKNYLRAFMYTAAVALTVLAIFFSIDGDKLDQKNVLETLGIIALFLSIGCAVLYSLISRGR